MFGILFVKIQSKKIILHIPKENIEILKDILNDKEVKKDAEELLDMLCMSFDMLDLFSDELWKTMRKFIIVISKEFPDWNKKGKI